ncbi:hydrolase [Pseudonocardia sp. CNS-139]|nr:hydrolase [Pseudonocardia sp. CNS-139]
MPPATGYTVTRGLRIPMRDGVELLADHYAPAHTPAQGTILVRGPYGRGGAFALGVRLYADRGYHVLLQSCRGTFGSGDRFQPMLREADDGQDTVAWLRQQEWFDGRLATLGPSYLGFTQWALLMDPPPELRTAVVSVGPHDFNRATHGPGAFSLGDFLGWAEMVANQEDPGVLRSVVRMATRDRRLRPGYDGLPLADAGETVLAGRAPWYRDWVSRDDPSDPYWLPTRLDAALDRVQVPVLIIGGWYDLFADQTLEQYVHLHRRGLDVALTMGAWTHMDIASRAGAETARETLDWLGEHVAGRPGRRRAAPVRIQVTGADGGWRGLPEWPPPADDHVLFLTAGAVRCGGLAAAAPTDGGTAQFVYDPEHPTPAVGGRVLIADAGVRDNRALEARPDVLLFTGEPLAADLEVVGVPVVEVAHGSDNPHADLFVRICDVDPHGRSRNLADGFARLTGADRPEVVHIRLDALAHRFPAGHRIRLQVSGGAHPRFARNLGTGEPAAGSTRTRPSQRTVTLDGSSRLVLPVAAG